MSGNIGIELQPKAESYSSDALAKIDIDIGPVGIAYRGALGELRDVARGSKGFSAIYIEGIYGSGKTLILRRLVYDIISGDQLRVDLKNIFPIYFFLGEMDFRPLNALRGYIKDLEGYVEGQPPIGPKIIGEREGWRDRIQVLREKQILDIISNVESQYRNVEEKEVIGFFEVLREMNRCGYYPLLILDEFERVIYTGEGLRTDAERKIFATFASKYLELTRGHLYRGAFIIATTRPINELIDRAIREEKPHIRSIFDLLGIGLDRYKDFPMVREHIVYDQRTELAWHGTHLDALARRYNFLLHGDVLNIISAVLPIPRAIIQIERSIRTYIAKPPKEVTPTEFYKIIQPRIDKFIEALKKEKVDNRFIIGSRAAWHERFIKLLENGRYVVKSKDYDEIAKIMEVQDPDDKKRRQKVGQIMGKLRELGLYESWGAGEYRLNQYILAYSLDIERLPDGSLATLGELVTKIKNTVKEIRERQRKYRETKTQEK